MLDKAKMMEIYALSLILSNSIIRSRTLILECCNHYI